MLEGSWVYETPGISTTESYEEIKLLKFPGTLKGPFAYSAWSHKTEKAQSIAQYIKVEVAEISILKGAFVL